jgi:hypothetical protein
VCQKAHIFYKCEKDPAPFLFDFLIELENAIEMERYSMKERNCQIFDEKWHILCGAMF